eukprot:TRINITY_DN3148_c0_g1_i3.p1 TRINITY_DN3148_c0_g1~~TRINITY_DN3148_c0_g1_i3.p1  ORF type:complete len:151 (-),score=22.60 TRINITY_DN3148_c0_g1_i3:231-683(-)
MDRYRRSPPPGPLGGRFSPPPNGPHFHGPPPGRYGRPPYEPYDRMGPYRGRGGGDFMMRRGGPPMDNFRGGFRGGRGGPGHMGSPPDSRKFGRRSITPERWRGGPSPPRRGPPPPYYDRRSPSPGRYGRGGMMGGRGGRPPSPGNGYYQT